MRIVTLANFQQSGSGSLPAGFKYVSIAPDSDVDVCKLGAYTLGVGSVVPWADSVTALRGSRKVPATAGYPGGNYGSLTLALWEACERPQPGPRAPKVLEAKIAVETCPTTAFVAGSAPQIVVPFMGRRQASFYFKLAAGLSINYAIRGVKYRRSGFFDGADAANTEDFFTETTGTFTEGVTADGNYNNALAVHIGGNSTAETFDELEFYAWTTAGASFMRVIAEVFGERAW